MYSLTYRIEPEQPPRGRLRRLLIASLTTLVLGLAVIGTAAPASAAAAIAMAACPGAVPQKLAVGLVGQVSITPAGQTPLPVRVHQSPAANSAVLFMLADGASFTVIGGPNCTATAPEPFSWWQIKAGTQTGWVAEGDSHGYFVIPMGAVATAVATAAVPVPSGAAPTITDLGQPPKKLCPDTLPSLVVASPYSPDSPINAITTVPFYSTPDVTSPLVATAQPGESISVDFAAGQTCAAGRLWWHGTWQSSTDSSKVTGYFVEADADHYNTNPLVLAGEVYTPTGSHSFVIDFGGVRVNYNVLWEGMDNKAVTTQWFGRGSLSGMGAVGAASISMATNCDGCDDPAAAGPDLSVYQIQDNLLDPYLRANAAKVKGWLGGNMPLYQGYEEAVAVFGGDNDARPVLNSQFKKLPFKGGAMVRFVTIAMQAEVPVNYPLLEYSAEAITADGQRLVVFHRWLNLPDLVNNNIPFATDVGDGTTPTPELENYYKAVAKFIENVPDSHFSVSLNHLDSLAESIQVGPLPASPWPSQ